jgi:hypothetical protein
MGNGEVAASIGQGISIQEGSTHAAAGTNGQNMNGVLRSESCSRTGIIDRLLAAAAFLTGISEIRQWWVR